MACQDFAEESKCRIYEWIRKDKSKKIIEEIVYNSTPRLFWIEYHSQLVDISKRPYLKDININKLQKFIKQNDIKIYQNELFLGKDLTNKNELFYSPSDLPELFKELNSTVTFAKTVKETSSETREYVKNEILRLIFADDYRSVEQLLTEYAEAVKMKYSEEVLLDEILKDISEFIYKAVECDSFESFNRIDSLIVNVLMSALDKKRIGCFNRFLGLAKICYTATVNPRIDNKTARWSRELSARRLRETIWVVDILIEKQKDIKNIKLLNNFAYWGYLHFSDLLYVNICHNDIKSFSFGCNQLDNIKLGSRYDNFGDLEYELRRLTDDKEVSIFIQKRMSDFYHFCCIVGTKYWLYWLYKNNQISSDLLAQFLQTVKLESHRNEPRFWDSLFSGKDRDLKIQRQRVLLRELTTKKCKQKIAIANRTML